jgi:hypothetical protein
MQKFHNSQQEFLFIWQYSRVISLVNIVRKGELGSKVKRIKVFYLMFSRK